MRLLFKSGICSGISSLNSLSIVRTWLTASQSQHCPPHRTSMARQRLRLRLETTVGVQLDNGETTK